MMYREKAKGKKKVLPGISAALCISADLGINLPLFPEPTTVLYRHVKLIEFGEFIYVR